LEKVDVAYYERIQSGNRNFDLAFVFKDFLLPDAKIQEGTTWVRINSIDTKYYDQVREVLQKSKLPQFEGSAPLKWNDVLKQYRKNFEDITHDGGWVCILGQGDDEEQARMKIFTETLYLICAESHPAVFFQEEEHDEDDDESFAADDDESGGSSEVFELFLYSFDFFSQLISLKILCNLLLGPAGGFGRF
jgi:nucleosome binding factor SPN SPT16 subunit